MMFRADELERRHSEGVDLTRSGAEPRDQVEPDFGSLPGGQDLPEIAAEDLTAEILRAAILGHGSLLVRGLGGRDECLALADRLEEAFAARAAGESNDSYREFEPRPEYPIVQRAWVAQTNAMWLADSPAITLEVLEMFERAGLRDVFDAYLGEAPAFSLQKSTLRKVEPDAPNAWHQDGAFMGDVRAMNVWLSLSRCGDLAPGLDVVPKRLEEIVPTGTEGAMFDWSVAQDVAEETAGDSPILRPIFEPGDALLFDEWCLHNTAADPSMPNPRYAVESWFFGPAAFPDGYAPLAF